MFLAGFLALGLTGLLWVRELHEEERRAQALFRHQAGMIADQVETQMNLYAQLLHSAAGMQMHSDHLLRVEWRRYVDALELDKTFPGVSGIGLVLRVPDGEKYAFAAKAREEWPEFQIFPERDIPEHYVNYLLEPERVYRAIGFDLASRDDRRQAAEQARDSGEIAITAKTTLITPGASGSDLLFFRPLYKSHELPTTVEQRRKALWGWVSIGVSIPQMMRSIHERIGGKADIAIYDGLEKRPESLLFEAKSQAGRGGGEHYRHDVHLLIGGRIWVVDFTSLTEFEDAVRSGRAIIVLAAGVVAVFLMALFSWMLLASKARTDEAARRLSEELARERDHAMSLLSASPAAILTLDSDCVITRSNPAGGLLAGMAPDGLIGKSFTDVFVPASDNATFTWSLSTLKAGGGPLVLEITCDCASERRVINWTFSSVREAGMPLRYFVAAGIDVTSHRQAEESLKAERALFLAGPVVVFRWKAEAGWPVMYVSPNVAQFGCSPGALLSGDLPFTNLMHPDDLGRVASEAARFTAQGLDVFEQRYRLIRPSDNEVRWVDDRTQIERDGQGKAVSYLGYVVDVTEREKSEEARRASEKRIARVLEMSSEGYWELDAFGRTIAVNPALLEMLEIGETGIMGRTPQDFMAPGWEDRMKTIMDERLSVPNRRFEMAYRSTGGRVIHTRVNATSIFDSRGRIIGSYGLLTDITVEKMAEEAMKNEQGRLRLIVDSVPLALVISRIEEAVVVNANQAALQMFGFGDGEMRGHPSAEFYVNPDDRKRFIAILRQTGVVTDFETQLKRRDGRSFWALLSARMVTFDDMECVLIGFLDISSRKQAEKRLEDMAEELSRSNAELEQFAYVASHDLQEPLRMIASYVQLLERRYAKQLDQDASEYIGFAVDGAKRMQTLITDLLEFSRVSRKSEPFTNVSLDAVVAEALSNLAVAKREAGAVITADPLPEVTGDQAQLLRLFQNLIGNAIKYRHPDRVPEIRISAHRLDGALQIRVEDNGIGIAKAYFERIFVIFQRLHTREDYPGTGIGLALCKKIVERHGGHIRVESTEGDGAVFVFTLPTQG